MKKWILTASRDGILVDYETTLESENEPDFWTCYEIADKNDCTLWSIDEFEED